MRKIVWISGTLAGVLLGSNFFLSDSLSESNYNSMEAMGFASMFLVFALTLFFGVQRINSLKYSGHIKFSQAFVASIYIVLIASVIYTLMWEVYFQNHGDAFVDSYLENLEHTLNNSTLNPETIEGRLSSQTQVMESYRDSLMVRFSLTMTEIFPIGLLMALLNGILQSFLARKRESKG